MDLREGQCQVEHIGGVFDMDNIIPQRIDAVKKEVDLLSMSNKTLIVRSGKYKYAIEFSVRINDYDEDSLRTVECFVPGMFEGLLYGEGESMEEAIGFLLSTIELHVSELENEANENPRRYGGLFPEVFKFLYNSRVM